MKAALKAYKKLTIEQKKLKLIINPYDLYVWNKNIDRKQLLVMFHIDNHLITYESDKVVTECIN